jgi:hypothetical protein
VDGAKHAVKVEIQESTDDAGAWRWAEARLREQPNDTFIERRLVERRQRIPGVRR